MGPDLSRPEVLGRLGLGYVASTLARPDQDPFDTVWKVMLRRLGAPRSWPLDIRQCLAGHRPTECHRRSQLRLHERTVVGVTCLSAKNRDFLIT